MNITQDKDTIHLRKEDGLGLGSMDSLLRGLIPQLSRVGASLMSGIVMTRLSTRLERIGWLLFSLLGVEAHV